MPKKTITAFCPKWFKPSECLNLVAIYSHCEMTENEAKSSWGNGKYKKVKITIEETQDQKEVA